MSSSDIAISVRGLSKLYTINHDGLKKASFRELVVDKVKHPFRKARTEQFWALKDVSFDVKKGDVVGIIGRNGAGKSTLLKIMSRIVEPTKGEVDMYGRVGSLLEVGTGFHPELTGRENVYLNGAILGMRRAEIKRQFDAIVDFAEVEKFLDTPVKRYSSGMYVRLAFAVAAHLNPEILIVDEVLAVGDANFQKKCLGKMKEVSTGQGRTVLFVSHNMVAMQQLCPQVVWLNNGSLHATGESASLVSDYMKIAVQNRTEATWHDPASAPGNSSVRLHRAIARSSDRRVQDQEINVHSAIDLEFEYWNLQPGTRLNLSVVLLNQEGAPLFNTTPINERHWCGRPHPAGLFRSVVHIPGDLLNDGLHRVQLLVVQDQSVVLFKMDDVLVFDVQEDYSLRSGWFGKWVGAVRPSLQWETEMIGGGDRCAGVW